MKKRQVRKIVPVVEEKPEPTAIENLYNARRKLEWFLDYELKRCIETKKEFLNAAIKHDPADIDLAYLVKRSAEDIFLASYKERELLGLIKCYKETIDSQEGGVQYVLEILQKAQESECQRLLESPYRHNSTCAMSNFHQECEYRAKADFWHGSGFGRGTVRQVLRDLKDWLAAENEIIEFYRSR